MRSMRGEARCPLLAAPAPSCALTRAPPCRSCKPRNAGPCLDLRMCLGQIVAPGCALGVRDLPCGDPSLAETPACRTCGGSGQDRAGVAQRSGRRLPRARALGWVCPGACSAGGRACIVLAHRGWPGEGSGMGLLCFLLFPPGASFSCLSLFLCLWQLCQSFIGKRSMNCECHRERAGEKAAAASTPRE